MMKIFKFKINDGRTQVRGEFVSYGNNNEIIGIIKGKDGNIASFIKGLFIDNKQLIFVVISKEKHYGRRYSYHNKTGYGFKDINKQGVLDEYDWLSGLFSGESKMEQVTVKVYKAKGYKRASNIRRAFKEFYYTLEDWDQFYLDKVQDLKEYLKYI